MGDQRQLVVEFSDDDAVRLCIVDLARTAVEKLVNGVASGEITANNEHPEGKLVARWKLEELGDSLYFSGEVIDDEIAPPTDWPFMRTGVQLWLDLRPAARFAGINPDRNVADLLLTAREKPFFSITPVAWISPRLMYAVRRR